MVQHTGKKRCKELTGVVWPGRCFRMKLHRKHGQFPMPHAFNDAVIEVDVRGLEHIRHGTGINSETVIFGGNEDPFCLQVADWLITTVMPKFQFHGLRTTRQGEDLMPETNAHDRLQTQTFFDLLDNIGQSGGVAWPIREKHPVWLQLKNSFDGCGSRYDGHPTPPVSEAAQDIALDAVIIGYDCRCDSCRRLRLYQGRGPACPDI